MEERLEFAKGVYSESDELDEGVEGGVDVGMGNVKRSSGHTTLLRARVNEGIGVMCGEVSLEDVDIVVFEELESNGEGWSWLCCWIAATTFWLGTGLYGFWGGSV